MKDKNLKIIIIDDEERSRLILKSLIEEYINKVTIVAMAGDVLEGIKVIQKYQPDVVFLDIEMPGFSGFQLVDYFDEMNSSGDFQNPLGQRFEQHFETVFTTAYEKYAVKAYKAAAIGYLLKPIDIDDLIDIFSKIRKKKAGKFFGRTNNALAESHSEKLVFPTQNGLIYIKADEICYLESSGRYTDVYLIDNEKMLTTLSLKDCIEKLSHSTFIRIHRSCIINLTHIKNYSKGRDSFVILDNDKRVDVGLFYKDDLNKAISSFLK